MCFPSSRPKPTHFLGEAADLWGGKCWAYARGWVLSSMKPCPDPHPLPCVLLLADDSETPNDLSPLLPCLQVTCSVCYTASPSSMTVRLTTWAAAVRKPS